MYNTMLGPQLCPMPPHQPYYNRPIYDPQQHIRSNRFPPNLQGLACAPCDFFHMKDRDFHSIHYQFHNQAQRIGNGNWKFNDVRRQPPNFYTAPQQTLRQIPCQTSKKGFWNSKYTKREAKCPENESNGSDNGYNSDSGFSSRSPTPNKADDTNSDESSVNGDTVKKKNCSASTAGGNMPHCSYGTVFTHQIPRHQQQYFNNHYLNNHNHNRGYQQPSTRCVLNSATQSLEQQVYPSRYINGKNMEFKRHNNRRQMYFYRDYIAEEKTCPPSLLTDEKWNKLSQGIWDKYVESQQKCDTYRKKMALWRQLKNFISNAFPEYRLYVVGSTVSGFGSENSDMDLCLLVRHSEMDQRNEAVCHLESLLRCLQRCDFIEERKLIQAKVPILRFRDTQGFDVDLNCNNSVGIRNTHLLHCYSQIDWRVRPLVLITKLWAQRHNINDAKSMTISSYSLVLMVIHFLQCGTSPHVLPCLQHVYQEKFSAQDVQLINIHESITDLAASENKHTLGELFLEFLHYYVEFDYSQYAISVRLGKKILIDDCRLSRSLKNDPLQWKYLCIEEPFDLTNTARSVYDKMAFENIKSVFAKSYHRLNETRDIDSIFLDLEDET